MSHARSVSLFSLIVAGCSASSSPTGLSAQAVTSADGNASTAPSDPPMIPGDPPGPPAPDYMRYASAFCRTLKNPATTSDQKAVIAAVLEAEAYDSDRGWRVLVKDGLARIQFTIPGTGLLANHNFSAQLYADVNNPVVPGGCFALAIEGTQLLKGPGPARIGDIWSDISSAEIRRMGVVNGVALPGGPPSPLYVAEGFQGVAAQAVTMVEQLTAQYPEFLPTSGDVVVDLLTGQSMGGAIAGVLAHAIEHFNLRIRLPGPPDANGIGSCPTADSPIARIVNNEGGILFQAPRAIAVVPPGSLPERPRIRHIYEPDDAVPQLPTTDLRTVQTGTFMIPVAPWAAPTTALSTYTDWPNPLAIRWNTSGTVTSSTFSFTTPGATTPWFAIPPLSFSASFVTGIEGGRTCSESPRGRALNMQDSVPCDGNTFAASVGTAAPKNLDSRSGFVKYAFAYAAGRLPDENLAPYLRPDDGLNNRYPALLAGGLPVPPDSPVGKSCAYGVYCNNPVSTVTMLQTMLQPLLNAFLLGAGGPLAYNLYIWNPFGAATFVEELAAGTAGTIWFHNPVTVSVAVGRLFGAALMIETLNQIPIGQETQFVPKFTCGPANSGIVGVSCGATMPGLPGDPSLPVACARAI